MLDLEFSGPSGQLFSAARDVLSDQARTAGLDQVTVSSDFAELLQVNQDATTAGTWFPLFRTADMRFRRIDAGNVLWMRAANARGEVVAVQVAALLDCDARSFGTRLADLSAFYDRRSNAAPGEWCRVTSALAHATFGRVVWTFGGWARPDYRGKGLLPLLNRVGKLAAWSRWEPDCFVGVVEPAILPFWSTARIGPRTLEDAAGIEWHGPEGEHAPMHFMRFSRDQFQADAVRTVAALVPAQ